MSWSNSSTATFQIGWRRIDQRQGQRGGPPDTGLLDSRDAAFGYDSDSASGVGIVGGTGSSGNTLLRSFLSRVDQALHVPTR